jgi:hypothetical protein
MSNPIGQNVVKNMKLVMNTDQQLELGLHRPAVAGARRRPRSERARWWFAQMRATVAQAVDWTAPAAGAGCPSQTWLDGNPPRLKV